MWLQNVDYQLLLVIQVENIITFSKLSILVVNFFNFCKNLKPYRGFGVKFFIEKKTYFKSILNLHLDLFIHQNTQFIVQHYYSDNIHDTSIMDKTIVEVYLFLSIIWFFQFLFCSIAYMHQPNILILSNNIIIYISNFILYQMFRL